MDSTALRIGFAGTPEFAARHLERILETGHNVPCVYTQPDRRGGRGNRVLQSPVKQVANAANISVLQPLNFKDPATIATFAEAELDLLVVVAYGIILPQALLDLPRLGCINVHASLLPRWRGAAPIQRAIEAGDSETGITIMQMDAGLDTGDMLFKSTVEIRQDDTAATLHDRLLASGREALIDSLKAIAGGNTSPEQQDDAAACYASKLDPAEAVMNWELCAQTLNRKIRALHPFPVCASWIDERRVKIWLAEAVDDSQHQQAPGTILKTAKNGITVACGEHALRLTTLQLPGGKPMSAADMLNSQQALFAVGNRFHTL